MERKGGLERGSGRAVSQPLRWLGQVPTWCLSGSRAWLLTHPSTGGVAFLLLKLPPVHSLGFYKRYQESTQVARTQAHWTVSHSRAHHCLSLCAQSLCLCANSAPACLARCFFTLSELPSFKPQIHSRLPSPRQRCSSLI